MKSNHSKKITQKGFGHRISILTYNVSINNQIENARAGDDINRLSKQTAEENVSGTSAYGLDVWHAQGQDAFPTTLYCASLLGTVR